MTTEGMIDQMRIYELEIDQIPELLQIEIGLDVIDAENMIILPMNVQTWSQMIQMSMNQTELLYN